MNIATRNIPWPNISLLLEDDDSNWGPAITRAFDAIHQENMIMAAIMFPIAVLILYWPERKEMHPVPNARQEGVER